MLGAGFAWALAVPILGLISQSRHQQQGRTWGLPICWYTGMIAGTQVEAGWQVIAVCLSGDRPVQPGGVACAVTLIRLLTAGQGPDLNCRHFDLAAGSMTVSSVWRRGPAALALRDGHPGAGRR